MAGRERPAPSSLSASRVSLSAPGSTYGSNNHSVAGDKTNLFGATALVNYGFRDPEVVNPFVWGELGLMSYSFKSESTPASDTKDTGGVLAG